MVYISLYSGDIFQGCGPFTLLYGNPDETENSINSVFVSEPEIDNFFINKKKGTFTSLQALTTKKKHTV